MCSIPASDGAADGTRSDWARARSAWYTRPMSTTISPISVPTFTRGDRVTMIAPADYSDAVTFTIDEVFYDWADDGWIDGVNLSYGGTVTRFMVDPFDIVAAE